MMRWTVALLLLAGGTAQAQGDDACAGRVVVNAVYAANGSTETGFDYFVQVQNQSEVPRRYALAFSGFPDGVVPVARLSGSLLRPFEQATIRFGHGPRAELRLPDVTVAYDAAGAAGPSVTLSGCRAGP